LIFVLFSFFAILDLDWGLLLVGHSDVARKDDGLKELKGSVFLAMVVGDEPEVVSELQGFENFGRLLLSVSDDADWNRLLFFGLYFNHFLFTTLMFTDQKKLKPWTLFIRKGSYCLRF
jgi:hypothetical protein